jgi:hypothetical protein
MTKRYVRLLTVLSAAAASAALASAAPASAVAVGPHQSFAGLVNTRISDATIGVLCPGPTATGHPLPDQTVAVELVVPPITSTEGYTGLDATSIVAWLNWPTPMAPPPPVKVAAFTGYGTAAIPTSLTVPCSGTGVMTFVPTPDDGGRPATVNVTFVNIGA